ncbi:MAG TPA: hypothetical protein VJM15_00730 [Sphingomicrobium sp.]|nr:hypothetical protein [Sphingomicrobium sp.]
MTKIMMTSLAAATAALGAGAAFLPATATAQDSVAEVVVFGNDPCPRSTDDKVVICARKPETERYRIPEKLRSGGPRQAREAWANKAKSLETVGATGTFSCSPVGPGGYTGCMTQMINEARRQRREATEQDTAPEQ